MIHRNATRRRVIHRAILSDGDRIAIPDFIVQKPILLRHGSYDRSAVRIDLGQALIRPGPEVTAYR
jgi:hypothetical protein